MPGTTLSIVIPVFNEEATIPELWSRLSATVDSLGLDYEVIFVDDGSSDGSVERIRELCARNHCVKLLRLSRNFGHQTAVTAGLEHAGGDAVIMMDADLQDQPEAIGRFVEEWRKGHEVVYAVRSSRRDSFAMRTAFSFFYRIMGRMSGIRVPLDAGVFSLIDRKVLEVLKAMPEKNRYLPGLRAYAGFRQRGIEVERAARFSGTSRVRLSGLFNLALNGLISFSYLPIRLITLAGVLVALCAFGAIAVILFEKLVSHKAILGWASTLTAILFLGGVQLVTLGLIGEYIGRVYEEVKGRPYYIVMEKTNFEPTPPA